MHSPDTWHLDKYVLGIKAESAFIEKCKEQRANYIRVTGQYGLSDEDEKNYEESLVLGTGMIRWFAREYLLQSEYTPIAVEQTFQVPILDDKGEQLYCKCDRCWEKFISTREDIDPEILTDEAMASRYKKWRGLPVMYEGRIDVLMRDKNGGYWIVDWKTTARMMSEDADIVLETDDQVASYCWAFRRALGLNIRGFVYVELRKAFPEPPTENKVVRLGRKFSISRQLATDYKLYERTVMARDAGAYQAGLYNEYIDWLKNEGIKFIQIHRIPKPPQTLDNIGRYIYQQTLEMISSPAIYPSPGRFTCSWCPFQGPCIDQTADRDYQYALDTLYEIKPRYYEEVELSTDKKM
jgi:hypothetical protein